MPPYKIFSDEKWLDIREIGIILKKIGEDIINHGSIKIGHSEIKPDEKSIFKIKHEQHPKGELKLVIEIEWHKGSRPTPSGGIIDDLLKT